MLRVVCAGEPGISYLELLNSEVGGPNDPTKAKKQ